MRYFQGMRFQSGMMMKSIKLFSLMRGLRGLDHNRLIHSLKTAVAFLIGLLIVRMFDFYLQGRWILISILVVMCAQSRVGAILQKSYMRFLGTLMGAAIAALTLYLVYPSVIWTTLILCLAVALFSYVADSPGYLSEAGPIGVITVVIVLIGQNPSYITVLGRCFEISLGILIALLVSRFVWPLHSRTQLRYLLENTLEDLKMLAAQLGVLGSVEAEKTYGAYEDKIMSRFISQNKLQAEVIRESFDRSGVAQDFKKILRGEREILHDLNLMRNALAHFSSEACITFNQQTHVKKIYEVSKQLFESIIDRFSHSKKKHPVGSLCNFLDWKNEMQRELKPLVNNTADELAVDVFIFAAERLLTQLKEMDFLITKV